MNDTIQMIPLDQIEPHPANRRVGGFDQLKLEQLADSIRAVGVQQPAIVRRLVSELESVEGVQIQYQLVAGERRWRASRIAGLDSLPCIVRELDDVTALEIQTIENLQRDDIHPLDEADGYSQLLTHDGYTIETIASKVGKSASYIYQRLKLSSLIDEARELFVQNKITAGHAILMARLGPEQQKLIIEEGLFESYDGDEIVTVSVRDLGRYIYRNILLDLSRITWKLSDANLVPEAGACQECPKRTGYHQPEVFADVCKYGDGNGKGRIKDYCTDKTCFELKQARIVEVKKAELAAAGQDVIEVVDGYGRNAPQGALDNWKWSECKKSTPGAKKVLVVAGTSPGRVTYGTIISNNSGYIKTPEEKAAVRKKREALKAAEALGLSKVDAVLDAAEGKLLPLEALRICVKKVWERWWHEHRILIAQAEGWTYPTDWRAGHKEIDLMDIAGLNRLLLRIAMTDEIKVSHYSKPDTKSIDALMKVYGVTLEKKVGKDAKDKEPKVKAKQTKPKAKVKKR